MDLLIRRYLRSHSVVISRIPFMLERGDPFGRSLALNIAITVADQPELLTVLRDFALGQNGPDEQRHRAAQAVHEAGLLPPVRCGCGWGAGGRRSTL